MTIQKFILFIFCTCYFNNLIAQQVIVQGCVKDTTNKPIVGASVILKANDSNGIIKYFKITDKNGNFLITISNLQQSLYFQISSVGFHQYSVLLKNPLTSFNETFLLKPFIGNLPEVYVKGEPEIVRRDDTTTYRVSAFEKGNENSISDLLKNLPGVFVTDNGVIFFNGKMIDRVLIEEDDMYGNNYASLIKNVSTNGLDKIDVIENYNDKSIIENNNRKKGNETVLNLRYKNKKLRLFGSVNLTGGIPNKNYEAKSDWLSLIPNIKFVATTNFNSLGNTANNLLGRGNNVSILQTQDELINIKSNNITNPINFNDITPYYISTSRALFNTSKIATLNSQLKISKVVTVKGFINVLADDYTQYENTIETYNNTFQQLIIEEDNRLEKINKKLDAGIEASWQPNNTFQSILKYNLSTINALHKNNGFLFQNSISQLLKQQNQFHQISLKSTKLITTRKFITTQLLYTTNQLNSQYYIQPPLYDTSFRDTSNYQHLYQPYNVVATTIAGTVRFYTSAYRKSFSIQLTGIKNNYQLNSEVFRFNKENNLHNLPNTYTNDINYSLSKVILNTGFNYEFNDKIKSSLDVALQWNSLYNEQKNYSSKLSKQLLQLLPSFRFEYKLNQDKGLILYINKQPILPELFNVAQSYVFTGLNTIHKGNSNLKIANGYTASFAYHYFGLSTKKRNFTIYTSISNHAINYLQNNRISGLYNFTSFELTDKRNLFANLFMKAERKLLSSKSWIIFNVNLFANKTYSLVNYQYNTNYTNAINTEIRWKTDWKKWVNINTGLIYSYQTLNTFYLANKINNYRSHVITSNTVLGFKLSKNINSDILVDYLLNKSENKEVKHIVFTDAQLLYNINEKIRLGFIAKNIFNQQSFTYNSFNETKSIISYFDLQPSFYLLTFSIKL